MNKINSSDKYRVFVFGTLKEGFPNFHANRGHRFPGGYVTVERFPLYLVGERFSPWLINKAGTGQRVAGQVFQVSQDALEHMDKLERTSDPDGYRRRMITVTSLSDQCELTAYAYFKSPEQLLPAQVRRGPLSRYTPEDARLYQSRVTATPSERR